MRLNFQFKKFSMNLLESKHILVGVSAGAAIYKTLELIRLLVKADARVQVIMTANAKKLISAQLFEAVSGQPVLETLFKKGQLMVHIEAARRADLFLICPATANVLAKIANGFADDLLTTTFLASNSPKMICPAMNTVMWRNAAVQRNVEILLRDGHEVLMPSSGRLLCGDEGLGAMAKPEYIFYRCEKVFAKKDLKGRKALITAAATREKIDPVRFISNFSSGKMGYCLAREASLRGAEVTLISGESALDEPFDVEVEKVGSAEEMYQKVMAKAGNCDFFISAAAVSDFRPEKIFKNKIKRSKNFDVVDFRIVKNSDILKSVTALKKAPFSVGFALEEESFLEKDALKKLKEKKCDLLVANSFENLGADRKSFRIYDERDVREFTDLPLNEAAGVIWNEILLKKK